MPQRRTLKVIIVVLTAGLLGLAAIMVTPSLAPAKRPIAWTLAWTPNAVHETILVGESRTVPLSFTSPKKLKRVVVDVSPELRSLVAVSPDSFALIPKHQPVNLTLTITAPHDALPQTVEGMIRLRKQGNENDDDKDESDDKESRDKGFLAKPLPVTVEVVWRRFANTKDGYSFLYPPEWTLSPEPSGGENLYEPRVQTNLQAAEHYTPPTVSIMILQKSHGISLTEFANSLDNGWYTGYENSSPLVIRGKASLLYNDLPDIGARQPPLAAFIDLGGDTVLLVVGDTDEATFFTILETLNFE